MKRLAAVMLVALLMLSGCSRDPKAQRDKYFKSGQKYLDDKKYEEAAIEFRNALRADNGHVPSYLGIAQTFQSRGDLRNAIAAYQQVLKLDSKNVQAKLKLGGYMLIAASQQPDLFKQVQQMAEEALQVEPSNKDALLLLANAYSGQNEIDKSIEQIEKALALDPDNLQATLALGVAQFRRKDNAKAEEIFKQALQKHPNEILAYLEAAIFYAATQRPQETENHLRKAFDIAPSDSRCLYTLANFYLAGKKTAEAENVFKEAIKRKPDEREPYWGLANFYFQQGKVDTGIEALNRLLAVKKGDSAALLRLAEIYHSQNNDAKAEENIRTVLSADPNNAQAHFLQGRILRRRQEYDKAMAEFDAAIKQNESLLPAYLEKANLQLMRNELDACENTLKAALQRNRDYMPARGAYARLLSIRQKPQEALQQAEEVLARTPNNEDALAGRAEALRISGKLEESRKDWIRLCEMQPQNAAYRHRLGGVEAMMGDNASAMANLRKAVELNPKLTDAINDILYLQIRAKQFDAAFSELDRLAKGSTPQDEIHRFRGQVYLAQQDAASAEREFRKTIEINPQNYQTYMMLGQLNAQRNNLPQAIKEMDQLIARNNKLASAYLLKALYMQLANDIAGAKTNYRKVLELDSENAVACNNLAWLFTEGNTNLEEALSLARTAKKKLPEEPEIAETLGWTYYKMKNYTLAADQLLFSVNNRKQPSAENYYRLGMAYHAKGDKVLAKQTLRKSLEMNAKFPGADEARQILKLLG